MSKSSTRKYPPDYSGSEKRWSDFLDQVCNELAARCKGVETSRMYWPDKDNGEIFCFDCRPWKWDGGTDNSEEDGQRFCDTCGMILECGFTDYGVEAEIRDSTTDEQMAQPIGWDEAYTLLQIIECGVPRLTERCGDFVYKAHMKPNIRRIAKRLKIDAGA